MENRKFTIEYIGIEWFIERQSDIDSGDSQLDIIRPITKIRNDKVVRIFDIFAPSYDAINQAKKYKEFYEICDFEVLANGYKFTGSFIDALEYIKANFKEVDDAHL